MARRVIFLDIDGVLAPIRNWERYEGLDPACVAVLNSVLSRAHADVVISSTWRYSRTVPELQAALESAGFTGRVIGATPTDLSGAERGDEIAAWLAEHPVDAYVIVDDHADMGALKSRLVLISPAQGLQATDVPRVVATLLRPLDGGWKRPARA